MINHRKYFVPPPEDESDFKELFKRLAASGAGRPVDENGIADGPWTPDLLMEAITNIGSNNNGVELRTVQAWFQDNDRGISPENIRWLARIFGCDDPKATSDWQAELTAAQERLVAKRRVLRKQQTSDAAAENGSDVSDDTQVYEMSEVEVGSDNVGGGSLAVRCEALFGPKRSIHLVVGYWFVYVGLIFLNYILGTLSVTYEPEEGLHKQVGFIWAPTLTLLPIVVLPLFILAVRNTLHRWKISSLAIQTAALERIEAQQIKTEWIENIQSHSFMFRSALALCILFVFGFQWAGIYLPAYWIGDAGNVQIDRYLVTLYRPDVISTPEAVVLSMIGYMYTASYIFIFLVGLILTFIVATDLAVVAARLDLQGDAKVRRLISEAKNEIAHAALGVVIAGIWIATCVKLQIVYLSSDGVNFPAWLMNDVLFFIGASERENGWLDQSSVNHASTSLMALLSCVVLLYTLMKTTASDVGLWGFLTNTRQIKMVLVVILVAANAVFAGLFSGFTLLAFLCGLVSLNYLRVHNTTEETLIYDRC